MRPLLFLLPREHEPVKEVGARWFGWSSSLPYRVLPYYRSHQTLSKFWFSNSLVAQEGKGMSKFLIHPPECETLGTAKD